MSKRKGNPNEITYVEDDFLTVYDEGDGLRVRRTSRRRRNTGRTEDLFEEDW